MGTLQPMTLLLVSLSFCLVSFSYAEINRQPIISTFNPRRNASSSSTPMQLGNGNFAFGADITGLQTFLPFNTLSSWGWHNSSLPTTAGQSSPADFTGLEWWTHGRLVDYDQPNPAEAAISQWLIANPHRINLGRVGLWFKKDINLDESAIAGSEQELDLYGGLLNSRFQVNGTSVEVQTIVDPESDTIAVSVQSELVSKGELGFFVDFPYASGANKFEAPFVGIWNATENHTTTLRSYNSWAEIQHDLDDTTYFTAIKWTGQASVEGPLNDSHRYHLTPSSGSGNDFSFTSTFSPSRSLKSRMFSEVKSSSASWWHIYWESGAFISLPAASNSSAAELQRRIILSQYLLAVNSASKDPPQESGLVNNGWYGKFHMEMYFWHSMHWTLWNKWALLDRSISVYQRFLPTSLQRAEEQGYTGARWGKMSDPSGRSAPGEINSLLIWQQPHPFYFAEMEWRQSPTTQTLEKWDDVLKATADFMASYAFRNQSTKGYDLGPPMYPVSENTNPNDTVNPTFELAYWGFGLDVASKWQQRQGKAVPNTWTRVAENLRPLPVQNGTYVLYEGVKDMWNTTDLIEDHPALLGINGWLPPNSHVNFTIFNNTIAKVYETWNFTYSYGWDFPLLAMTAARLGDTQKAIDWLLDPNFEFDDVGMPIGGARVPTPYLPGSSSLLLTVGMMAGGWDGDEGLHFPDEWDIEAEGFAIAM
ncbi:hypothetical protein AOQ84DRAFT_385184 [Glonium stellatum]|uniref:Six-hairpin glycosidase-like protein n=1 Tax=Glonium stellatum TaxID=574774 RepID=A0A8E2FAT9_9PEZI|nr:hypothetical protein AOQ84DRAFT_385184 [Glonium stellatum]